MINSLPFLSSFCDVKLSTLFLQKIDIAALCRSALQLWSTAWLCIMANFWPNLFGQKAPLVCVVLGPN